MKKEYLFYCEQKRWWGNRPMLCMLTEDALHLMKLKPTFVHRDGKQAHIAISREAFLTHPLLKSFDADNTEGYEFYLDFDEREQDLTPLAEAERFAGIRFTDKSDGLSYKIRIRTPTVEAVQKLADRVFLGKKEETSMQPGPETGSDRIAS